MKKHEKNHLQQTQFIFHWFLNIFIIISLLFCIALIPLFLYLQNTFTTLQLEKSKQQLDSGVSRISSFVTGMLNISENLSSDSLFLSLRYRNLDYADISVTTRLQLQSAFTNLMLPYDTASHIALHLDENVVITNNASFFKDYTYYYPDFFSVNDLSYEEWIQCLSDNGSGFMPSCHVKTYTKEYDALIFSTPWTNSAYLYACVNVSDLKKLIISNENLNNCYFTITGIDNEVLYSDMPDSVQNPKTLSAQVPYGKININVYIPGSVFYQNMRPLYLFLIVYSLFCICILISIAMLETRISAKPFTNIIQILADCRNIPVSGSSDQIGKKHFLPTLQNGFDYIAHSISTADSHLEQYQYTLQTQQKLLQNRFLEQALNGQLTTHRDIQLFQSYFPDFPKSYCLLLLKLWTYTTDEAPFYEEPLLLLQTFLKGELPNAYQHQLNNTDLLLLISEDDFVSYRETLNFLINNVNCEEPSYFLRGLATKMYQDLTDLPIAYQKLIDMSTFSFSAEQDHLYDIDDYKDFFRPPVTTTDLMTLYTSIVSCNCQLALSKLQSYSMILEDITNIQYKRPMYKLISAQLAYLKLEHAQSLQNLSIPEYQADKSLYHQLADTIELFCNSINHKTSNDSNDTFTEELFQYIDTHYTDCDLCISSLETHFKCSESTLRKAFKRATDVSISRYIEQKRIALADELLAQNEKSIEEIAAMCGYSLPHTFYRAYKRIYKHAPTMRNHMASEKSSHTAKL